MKNTVVFGAILLCLISVQSCTKNSKDNLIAPAQPNQFIKASISSGQTYVFTAGSTGTLIISQQASHYQMSQAGSDVNGSIIYKYNSIPGYTGPDEVILSYNPKAVTSEGKSRCPASQNGSDPSNTIISIKINITK